MMALTTVAYYSSRLMVVDTIKSTAMNATYFYSGIQCKYNFLGVYPERIGVFLVYPQCGRLCAAGDLEVDPVQGDANSTGSSAYWGVGNDRIVSTAHQQRYMLVIGMLLTCRLLTYLL